MARLQEHEGKALFKIAKMPIPQGAVAKTPAEARQIAEKIGKPVVIKVQIWAGGRGKAGGVKFADTPEEAEKIAALLLGATIKGYLVEKVLVEEKLSIDKEYYAGIIVNAQADARCPVVMFSTEGGMDIESVPQDKIALMNVDVIRGFKIYDALNLANKVKVPSAHITQVARLMVGLYETFKNYGARLIEINPMVVTKDGKVLRTARSSPATAASPSTIRPLSVIPSWGSRWPASREPRPRSSTRSLGGWRRRICAGPVISPR